jgi:DNA-binding transcriptional ArsR family regulator
MAERTSRRASTRTTNESRRSIGGWYGVPQLATDLDLTRGNVSNHLACLRGCGLVVAAPEGRQVRYELADPRLAHALTNLATLVLAVDPAHRDLPPEPGFRSS